MGTVGLWQQGEIGPHLAIWKTNSDDSEITALTNYLCKVYDKYNWETYGIVYIQEVETFYYLYYYPKLSSSQKFKKSYTVLLEIEINSLFICYFKLRILENRIGSFLIESHLFDKRERYEDILSKIQKANFPAILNAETTKEKVKLIDSLKLSNFIKVLSYLLDYEKIYLLYEDQESAKNTIHILNLLFGEMINIEEYIKTQGFAIIGVEQYDNKFIQEHKADSAIILSNTLEVISDLKTSFHYSELLKYDNMEFEERLIYMKGYVQNVINKYFDLIRSFATGQAIHKSEYYTIVKKISGYIW